MRLRPKNTTTANRQDPNCASAKSVGNTVATSGPDKRNVVEDERNHAPCRRELQTGEEGKDPDHQASQHAHGAADQHVSLELVGDLRARLQDGSRDVLVVEALDVLPGDIDSSRPRAVNTKVMTTNVTRPCSLSPISCTARMSQLALKFSTSRLVTKMPCSSSQSVHCTYSA